MNLLSHIISAKISRTNYGVSIFMVLFIASRQEFANGFVKTVMDRAQRGEVPEMIEEKILHDAHVLEGGEVHTVVKTLITGFTNEFSAKLKVGIS